MNKPLTHFFDVENVEKVAIAAFYVFLLWRMFYLSSGSYSMINFLYAFDQFWVLIFVLIRRNAVVITKKPFDWFIAFAATALPLFVSPVGNAPVVPLVFAIVCVLVGTLLHLSAKIILRRSFGVVAANRGVKIHGPYRLVRHPMYAGYMLTHVGLLLGGPSLVNFVIIAVCWTLLIIRIAIEERVLSKDPEYITMLNHTRFRLIPGIY